MNLVAQPPTGTVTLLLADLEGSTALWETDTEAMPEAMETVHELVDEVARAHVGYRPLEQGEGDSFVLAFHRASDAVSCALDLQMRLVGTAWATSAPLRFRMGLHTGEVDVSPAGRYDGPTVNRCARIRDLAHGGQTLASAMTVALLAGDLPEGSAGFRHMGECRLRGVVEPVTVHQLMHPDLTDDFPPIRTQRASNIAAPTDTFVGREKELAEVAALLDTTRLLTITGAGGSGKSRLAVELARADVEHVGTWLVELAPVRDGAVVARAVLDAIGAAPGRAGTEVSVVVSHLRERRVMLILDNCEHLLDATATLAGDLLQRCPTLTIVATSREPLALPGEVHYRIPSLEEGAAVELFTERARRANPNIDLTETTDVVAAIGRRLDGMPLAVELAAARTRFLSVQDIADGLDDRFRLLTGGARHALSRQRTLEASVGWSYDLLTQAEQAVLNRLSVFAGSFTIAGAEAVGTGGIVEADVVLDVLSQLVDRSLVQAESQDGSVRYRLLETIRAYARQKLGESEDPAEARNRHLDHMRAYAAEVGVKSMLEPLTWIPRIQADVDDLRAALDWARAADRPNAVLDIIGPLDAFWTARSMYAEIYPRLRDAAFAPSVASQRRAGALTTAASMATYSGDGDAGYDSACEAVDLAEASESADAIVLASALVFRAWTAVFATRESDGQFVDDVERALDLVGDEVSQAAVNVLFHAGVVHLFTLSATEARRLLGRASELAMESGLGWASGLGARMFQVHCGVDGRVEEARRCSAEVIALAEAAGADQMLSFSLSMDQMMEALYGNEDNARRHGSRPGEVARRSGLRMQEQIALQAAAFVELRFGSPQAAIEASNRNLDAAQHTIPMSETIGRWTLGAALLRAGEVGRAREQLEWACDLSADPPIVLVAGRARLDLARVSIDEGDLDLAWDHAHQALATMDGSDDLLGAFDALDVIAMVAGRTGDGLLAARVYAATDELRRHLGVLPFCIESDRREQEVGRVRDALPPAAFERARDEGSQLSAEDVVALVRRGRGDRGRPDSGWDSLTPAEVDVVRHLASGLGNAQIAEKLFVTNNTVKTHLKHVYAKLGMSSRAEVAAQATKRGIG